MSMAVYLYLCVCLFVCMPACLAVYLSIYLSVYLFVCLPGRLYDSICQSVLLHAYYRYLFISIFLIRVLSNGEKDKSNTRKIPTAHYHATPVGQDLDCAY